MSNDEYLVKEFKKHLHSTFHIKDSRLPKYFLSIDIARLDKAICLNQRKFVLEIISEADLS